MKFFTRTIIPVALLITTIGLGACDSNTDKANSSGSSATVPNAPANAPDSTPAPTSAISEKAAVAITISNPRIRATAPGQRVSGAFMTLTNSSATPFTLTAASFNAADAVEIHETSREGEMMQMKRINHIDIPANGMVELKPGSYHIMLMGLTKELAAGTTEELTLTFADDSQVTVEASVGDLSK